MTSCNEGKREVCTHEVGDIRHLRTLEDQEQKEVLSPKGESPDTDEEDFKDSSDMLGAEPAEPVQDHSLSQGFLPTSQLRSLLSVSASCLMNTVIVACLWVKPVNK